MPVDVVNFPTDSYGSLLATMPVVWRVCDLTDGIVIPADDEWWSDIVNVSAFNSIALQITAAPDSVNSMCRLWWSFAESDEPFFQVSPHGVPPLQATVTASTGPGTMDRTGMRKTERPFVRVRCTAGSSNATGMSDIKIAVRRD